MIFWAMDYETKLGRQDRMWLLQYSQ